MRFSEKVKYDTCPSTRKLCYIVGDNFVPSGRHFTTFSLFLQNKESFRWRSISLRSLTKMAKIAKNRVIINSVFLKLFQSLLEVP